jgi:hypothetical protein
LDSVEVVVVYYDGGGAIIGGEFTFVNFIPAGGTSAFEVTSFNDLPGLDHVEVYPQLSSLTLLGLD